MTTYRLKYRPARILDLDCEARPLSFLGSDYVTKEITAVAWSVDGVFVDYVLLHPGERGIDLRQVRQAYDQADLVTGHNVIKYDLPLISGALLESGLPPLGPKLVCDTYLHLKRRSGVSASQENLAAMLDVAAPKMGMSQAAWREANRLLPDGLVKTRDRVVTDVLQHWQLRQRLVELDWLKRPQLWRP